MDRTTSGRAPPLRRPAVAAEDETAERPEVVETVKEGRRRAGGGGCWAGAMRVGTGWPPYYGHTT